MVSSATVTLDRLLNVLAEDTWENLREANLLAVRFGEETITDTLMLALRRKGFLTFKQTSLRDEPAFGTDFECWVGADGTGWIGYAIQAKKLDFRKGTYRGFGHRVHSTGKRQIEILKDYAKGRRLTPRYCLYSYRPSVTSKLLCCCSRSFGEAELGCTLTPLATIEKALASSGHKDFYSLQSDKRTVPWRCLAICPKLTESLRSNHVRPDALSPLLDNDTIIHRQLPSDITRLIIRDRAEVDFAESDIGVVSGDMDHRVQNAPVFLIPKRVYVLHLPADQLG